MPVKTKIEPVFDATRNRWKVDVPASVAADGKRYKAWFKTRDKAREHLAGVNGADTPTAAIAPSLAMEADKARGILSPWDRDLVQGARELAAALEAIGDAGSILDAAKAYRKSREARAASKEMGKAVALYLDSRSDLRESTLKSYRYTLERVCKPLHGITLADIETADIEALLTGKGPTARKMHRANLGAFWTWAAQPARGWADINVLKAIEAPRISRDNDIRILKPAEVKALLHAAEAEGPAAAVAYAIAVFAGVRMAELGRLKWLAVTKEHIEIGRDIAKKHSRRLIPVCDTLRAWIRAYRGDAQDNDFIVPSNWTDVSKAVRRRAGWNVRARTLEAREEAKLIPKLKAPSRGLWPTNACRHTCASVQVAIGTSLSDLTFKFGHAGGHETLRAHYVSRLTKKDALSILSTGPKNTTIATIQAA
jgi:integrase/recombinase XerD